MTDRERFEAWAKPEGYDVSRPNGTYYNSADTRDAWQTWKAAVAERPVNMVDLTQITAPFLAVGDPVMTGGTPLDTRTEYQRGLDDGLRTGRVTNYSEENITSDVLQRLHPKCLSCQWFRAHSAPFLHHDKPFGLCFHPRLKGDLVEGDRGKQFKWAADYCSDHNSLHPVPDPCSP